VWLHSIPHALRIIKAKFHYASWFEAGLKLVADRFEAGRRPTSNLSATSFEPASIIEFGFYAICFEAGSKLVADRFEACRRPASNQLQTSSRNGIWLLCRIAVLRTYMRLVVTDRVAWFVGLSVGLSVSHTSEPCRNG